MFEEFEFVKFGFIILLISVFLLFLGRMYSPFIFLSVFGILFSTHLILAPWHFKDITQDLKSRLAYFFALVMLSLLISYHIINKW